MALHDACFSLDFDNNLEMLASEAAGGKPMQEGHEELLNDDASQVYEVPLRDDANQRKSPLRRAVSFYNLNSIHCIQLRQDLLDHKSDIWFGLSDISQFAQSKISHRRKIGNTSMSYCSAIVLSAK
jgi:hypothetical protein